MSNKYFILNSILIGVLINLILPLILKRFATTREIRSRGSTDRFTYKGQFMSMMVNHNKIPFISSIVVAIIIGISIFLGDLLKPTENIISRIWPSQPPVPQLQI